MRHVRAFWGASSSPKGLRRYIVHTQAPKVCTIYLHRPCRKVPWAMDGSLDLDRFRCMSCDSQEGFGSIDQSIEVTRDYFPVSVSAVLCGGLFPGEACKLHARELDFKAKCEDTSREVSISRQHVQRRPPNPPAIS